MNPSQVADRPRERIIRGKDNWWFLGPGGIARLKDSHLTAEGTLRPAAEQHLRQSGLFSSPRQTTYSLTVLTSTDCNLGCAYCFQNTGQDPKGGARPPRIKHSRLTSETITSILEFARVRMAAAELTKLHILLFGGEPLLNPRGCTELLARAADYGMTSAGMISNGTLLTPPLARKLSELGLRAIQVTFDGDRDEHDQIRVRRSGGGTFDAITQNMARVSEITKIRWNLRVNVSHHNHAGVDALIDRLGQRLEPARCSIHFARVGDVGIGYANDLGHADELTAGFIRWQRRALELGFKVGRPGPHKICATCSYTDGRYGAVVNADGVLASCWETAGKPGWEVGTTATGYLPSEQTASRWISCEDMYQYTDDDAALAVFRDTVDAAALDYLAATGRL